MMADFLNYSEKRLCILILISVKYFKKVRIKILKLRPYFIGHWEIWLQRLTLPRKVDAQFNEKICQLI